MSMDELNERTESYIEVTIKDKDNALAVPDTLKYSTQCLATNTPIKTDVVILPGSIVTIDLDAADSAIQDANNATEVKLLTVKATYGSGKEANGQYFWKVINMKGVS